MPPDRANAAPTTIEGLESCLVFATTAIETLLATIFLDQFAPVASERLSAFRLAIRKPPNFVLGCGRCGEYLRCGCDGAKSRAAMMAIELMHHDRFRPMSGRRSRICRVACRSGELVTLTGASERTPHKLFRTFIGSAPLEYGLRLRLLAVRLRLQSSGDRKPVTAIRDPLRVHPFRPLFQPVSPRLRPMRFGVNDPRRTCLR